MNYTSLSFIILFFFTSTFSSAQNTKLPDKAAPFTAVDWEEDQPIIQYNNEWYYFEKLDHLSKDEILLFCKNAFGKKWKKRFAEDLVEVLEEMGYTPKPEVALTLRKDDITEVYKSEFTLKNRNKVLEFSDKQKKAEEEMLTGYLSKKLVLEDLAFLDAFIQKHSSYAGLNGFDYQNAFDSLKKNMPDSMLVSDFGTFLTKTMGKIGDRHSYVRNYQRAKGGLPFSTAPLGEKVVALSYSEDSNSFDLYLHNYPYIKSINGTSTQTLLANYLTEEIMAPQEAFHSRASSYLVYINWALERNSIEYGEEISITFSNNTKDTIITFLQTDLVDRPVRWNDDFVFNAAEREALNDKKIAKTHFRVDENNIAYVYLPEMMHPAVVPVFYTQLNSFIKKNKNSKAMIIDVRGNGGGVRHLILEFAGYFIHPDSIYVVNVAQQRGERPLNSERKEDMHNRFLFSKDELNSNEKEAVDQFESDFNPMYQLSDEKFSEKHYAVFNGAKLSKDKFYYDRPVYILANERSFSAASVFVACFKDLPNVKIAGITTDGSSGNSENFLLPNSHLRIKLSTMVSFQKDGRVLDGYGTEPDIKLERSLEQLLWREDAQLEELKALIK